MPLYVAQLVNPINLEFLLTEDEERAVREAVASIRAFLDDYSPYAALLRNHMELEAYLDRVDAEFAQSTRAIRTAQEIGAIMLEVNRLIGNFVASARSYLDITGRRLQRRAAVTRSRYDVWCSVQYDQSLSYRIFENLRNVAQHRDLPIRAYSAVQRRRNDGTYEAHHALQIDVDAFRNAGIQAPVRDELAAHLDNIPVRPHLREYFDRLGLLHLQVLREIIDDFTGAAATIDNQVTRAGDPATVPIYFLDVADPHAEEVNLGLVDPHLHGVFLVRQSAASVRATDFAALDAAAHAHHRWPG